MINPEVCYFAFMRLALLLGAVAAIASAAPCVVADKTCREGLPLDGGRKFYVFRNFPLTEKNASIDRIYILVHGVNRDGDRYFRAATDSTRDAGKLDNTLVIAPHFRAIDSTCKDAIEPDEQPFPCRTWTDGRSSDRAPIDTFTAMDRLLAATADKKLFPNLKEIVVAGHSAGGQYVQRYAAANRIEPKLLVPVRYMVANPSSYLYFERWRPGPTEGCPDFNEFKYGVDDMSGYVAATGLAALTANYTKRNVTYLLGENDNVDAHSMDKTCPAMAQGPQRLARGLAYYDRMTTHFGAHHTLVKVPGCDHDAACMYRSENGRRAVFGASDPK